MAPTGGERPTPLWLSHHDPAGYDRCVLVGGRRLCRRCLILYPLALAVLVLARVTGWSGTAEAVALLVLALPAVVEFVLEQRGVTGYRPVRQALVTLPLGVGLGAGFARYLDRHTDPVFWGAVVVYGGICLVSALAGAGRRATRG